MAIATAAIRRRPWPGGKAAASLVTVIALLVATGFVPLALATVYGPDESEPSGIVECTGSVNLGRLADLPSGTVLADIDLGAAILLNTGHSVLGAPYHRNGAGIRTTFDLLGGTGTGSDLADAGVDYVAICPSQATTAAVAANQPESLTSRLVMGEPVPGVEALNTTDTIWIFAVTSAGQ